MNSAFYISGAVAIVATVLAISRLNAIHALLYFIVSLLAAGAVFFALGAPFVAALVVIVNAGAIMVLFVFVVMMLNLGPQAIEQERQWLEQNDGMFQFNGLFKNHRGFNGYQCAQHAAARQLLQAQAFLPEALA